MPKNWNVCRVTFLHKGGHKCKSELRNHKPMALEDTIGKVFLGVLNERRCRWTESASAGRGAGGLLVDRRLVKEMSEKKKDDRDNCIFVSWT